MTLTYKKVLLGLVIVVVMVGLIVPVGFWFLVAFVDDKMGINPVFGTGVSRIVAAAALFIGVFWITWAYSYLHFVGRGTPIEVFGKAIHATSTLVTSGPYAYTRNPLILGLTFLLIGVAALHGSIAGFILALIITAVICVYLIVFEEKELHQRFGEPFIAYKHAVPLLIPRLRAL